MMFMPRRGVDEDTWPRQHIIEAEIATAKLGMQDGGEGEREKKKRGAFGVDRVNWDRQKERRAVPCLVLDRTYACGRANQRPWKSPIGPSFCVIFRTDWDPCKLLIVAYGQRVVHWLRWIRSHAVRICIRTTYKIFLSNIRICSMFIYSINVWVYVWV